ncbi:DUF2057 family protein [Pantoea sp.]|uniref:YccT family protein n=1 Tax=Pantoea sp. TaxID=69393 RepID=UPI0031D8B205
MKRIYAVTGLLVLLVSATCQAMSLRLDSDIDILVLDGHRISGSLLKGADSLELERGQHQLLFRVNKTSANVPPFTSGPMIVTFRAETRTVTVRLPALTHPHERIAFEKGLTFRLVDEQGNEIASRRDRLALASSADAEQAMLRYNRTAQAASVPGFAQHTPAAPDSAMNVDFVWQEAADLPSLQRWFQRFDAATRLRFLSWMKTLRTS